MSALSPEDFDQAIAMYRRPNDEHSIPLADSLFKVGRIKTESEVPMSTLSREVVGELTARLLEHGMAGTREALLDHDAAQRAELEAKDQEIARLTAERDEARKRLAWLATGDNLNNSFRSRNSYHVWAKDNTPPAGTYPGRECVADSLGGAIDDAMEQEKRK